MYFNKFSSGTILALLALSGMLFLVPLAVPAHATQNPSLPTVSPSLTAYISGAGAAATTAKISNPLSNSYAITSFTFFAPAGFAFDTLATCAGAYLNVVSVHTAAAVTCTGSLAPGFSDTVNLGGISASAASPVSAVPPTGTFTTSLIDAGSSPASYTGPTWISYDVAIGTVTTVTSPAGSTTFTAGSSPITVTANDGTTQPGVPYTFSITAGGYPHAGFTASVSPVTSVTGSNGKTTTSFTPSNWATDSSSITATVGGGAGGLTGASQAIVTIAGGPSTVGWSYAGPVSFNAGKTFYLTGAPYFGVPTVVGGTRMGEFPAGAGVGPFAVSVSDAFGNAIAYGAITAPVITVSASGGTGFDNAGASLLNTISCTAPAGAVNCATGAITLNYFQTYQYGSAGSLTAIITGQYPGATPFSVGSNSGNIVTGTDATSYPLTISAGPYGAGTAVKLTATPNVGNQPGVPVTFNLCGQQAGRTVCAGTTVGYGGSFSGAGQTGYVSSTSGASGTATASYTLDATLGNTGTWNSTAPAPTVAQPTAKLGYQTSAGVVTVAGAAASFKALVYWADQATLVKSSVAANQVLYLNIELVDAYGNLAVNTGITQIQIQLSATSPTTLAATTLYIPQGFSQTLFSFGSYVAWTIPTGIAVGTGLTLTMSGVVNGVAVAPSVTLTTVSPLPTFNVKTPTPTAGTIYSSTTGVTFKGWANVSAGYNPATTNIASIGYKIGSATWQSVAAAGNKDNYLLSLFMPVGLSTIQFNATDSTTAKNLVVSTVYNVLVDTAAPTFTFGSASTNTGCVTVTAATAEGDFNPATFSATYGGVAVPAGAISWSGTQTAGTAGSLVATICGLVSGTATLSVTGSTWAGLSATSTESLTVTVPFANSITFNTGTATYGLNGAFKGLTISVTNGWNTAQTIVVYATFKSGSSIYVADGTVTLAAGGTASVFCLDLQTIPAGTYSVTFAAVTTANQAVSAPTTAINVVAT